MSESWIATDAFPGCFVRTIVQDVSTSVGAFCAPRSLDVFEAICLMTCLEVVTPDEVISRYAES